MRWEAAEYVIEALFKKQEEAFTSVAFAQCLITDDKKNGCNSNWGYAEYT